ncbi:MAG: NADPH-dependent reductase [Anaerocolumna sp.]|jgi:multimeric flavodoxin WrbA|nr:NADPH-dependent reductase [Anaerocolumna sp.]
MSIKLLIISASPRIGGNTELLCKEFLSGARSTDKDGEVVYLRNMNIHYCKACEWCIKNPGECIQTDDMSAILDKMIKAEVIVLASPIHFNTMDARMKTFIDRTYARYKELNNKNFYYIVTGADERKLAMERTLEEFRGFTNYLFKAKVKGIIYGTGTRNKGDIKGTRTMKQAFEMGRNI